MTFTIFASDLAACIGLNQYSNTCNVAKKIWKRESRDSFVVAQKRNNCFDSPEYNKIDNIRDIVNFIEKEQYDILKIHIQDAVNSTEGSKLSECMENIQNLLETSFPQITIPSHSDQLQIQKSYNNSTDLISDIKSAIYKERGTILEDKSIANYSRLLSKTVAERNTKFYKKRIQFYYQNEDGTMDRLQVVIGGKIDGVTNDGELVEVKNRQWKIFDKIPIHEMIQIHIYMYLLDKTSCQIIQCFENEMKIDNISFSDELWEDIIMRLKIFAKNFSTLLQSEQLQNQLLLEELFENYFVTYLVPR